MIETAPLKWWVAIGLVMPLATEASDGTIAHTTMQQCGYAVPSGQFQQNGQVGFGVMEAPPELADWLGSKLPTGFSNKCPGGWLTLMGQFVPVWGASGLRVVEKQYIQAARNG